MTTLRGEKISPQLLGGTVLLPGPLTHRLLLKTHHLKLIIIQPPALEPEAGELGGELVDFLARASKVLIDTPQVRFKP